MTGVSIIVAGVFTAAAILAGLELYLYLSRLNK